jgi:hypothetical protein
VIGPSCELSRASIAARLRAGLNRVMDAGTIRAGGDRCSMAGARHRCRG